MTRVRLNDTSLVFLVVSLPEGLEVVLELSGAMVVVRLPWVVGMVALGAAAAAVPFVPVRVVLEGGQGLGGLPGHGSRSPPLLPPVGAVVVAVASFVKTTKQYVKLFIHNEIMKNK